MEKPERDDRLFKALKVLFYLQIGLIIILTAIHEGGIEYVHLKDLFICLLIYTVYFTVALVGILIIAALLLKLKISHEDRSFEVIVILSMIFAGVMTTLFYCGVISFFGTGAGFGRI